jgi:ubiquinone/menaquinone biosynthesis C-methylase UbiE
MQTFEREWRARFERFARCYDSDHCVSGWSDQGLRRRLTLFGQLLSEQALPPPARILDLGCGGGSYIRFLADLGHSVVGLDYSLPSLARALAADPRGGGRYVSGEAYCLPFGDGSFDLVVSIGVFQALQHPARALCEMVRVLRPEGVLVIEFLNAFEPIALLKCAAERIRGYPPRVRTYSLFQVQRWFAQNGVKLLRRAGVYLPPRQLPGLGLFIEQRGVVRLLEAVPGLSVATAHAFMLVGEKVDAQRSNALSPIAAAI